jgi:hypothetical protein
MDRVLRSLGFSRRTMDKKPEAVRYEHPETGALIILPAFADEDHVLDYHLVGVRGTLDNFGVAAPSVFDAKLQKAG